MSNPDPWALYELMLRSRLFEDATAELWREGLISGELHLGTGEEGIIAGVVSHLAAEDAMALDHRGTAALVMRGVDPVLVLRELLGRPDGLCHGMGGHMHLFSKEHLAAASGIVGSAGPTAVGFALAAQHLRPGAIAVAFFGEGALNQGMLMESMNLAAVWRLPVLFICKDDGWSISSRSSRMTAGTLADRARGFGLAVSEVDGTNVLSVWQAGRAGVARARSGHGPSFIRATCAHLEAHFLGFQLVRIVREPLAELPRAAGPMVRSLLAPGGASFGGRAHGLQMVLAAIRSAARDPRRHREHDPLHRARLALRVDSTRLESLEERCREETYQALLAAVKEPES